MNRQNLEIIYFRGIAISLTLFLHSGSYLWENLSHTNTYIYNILKTWIGVDIFFVISGYVIAESFKKTLSEISSLKIVTQIFYIKRFFRIIPVSIFWLCIYLILSKYFNSFGSFGNFSQNLKDSIPAIFQYANYYGLSCWGPQRTTICGPNGIYWSLSLEEQFYLLFPFVFYIFRKHLKYFLLSTIGLLCFFNRPEWTLGWAFRVDAFLWGILLSEMKATSFVINLNAFFNKKIFHLFLLPVLIGALIFFEHLNYHSISIVAFISFVLILTTIPEKKILFPFKSLNYFLYWLGSRSYSIYLCHVTTFRFFIEFIQRYAFYYSKNYFNVINSLGAYALLVFLSECSYRFLEIPLKKMGHNIAKKIV